MNNIMGCAVDTFDAMGDNLKKLFHNLARRKAARSNTSWTIILNRDRSLFIATMQKHNAQMLQKSINMAMS